MKRTLIVFFAVAALALSAFAARADDATDGAKSLATVTAADLDAAAAIAKEHNDADGLSCAVALKAWLVPPAAPVPTTAPTVAVGLFSRLEEARLKGQSVDSLVAKIQAGAPREVVIGCAMVTHDAKVFLGRFAVLFARVGAGR